MEMGKTDLRETLGDGIVYRPFDLGEATPARIGELLAELVGLFAQGVLMPLPVRVFDVRRVREAFGFVSRAEHVGKVVLRMPRRLDPDGTVVVTGATGALGRLVAVQLVEQPWGGPVAAAVAAWCGRRWCGRVAGGVGRAGGAGPVRGL